MAPESIRKMAKQIGRGAYWLGQRLAPGAVPEWPGYDAERFRSHVTSLADALYDQTYAGRDRRERGILYLPMEKGGTGAGLMIERCFRERGLVPNSDYVRLPVSRNKDLSMIVRPDRDTLRYWAGEFRRVGKEPVAIPFDDIAVMGRDIALLEGYLAGMQQELGLAGIYPAVAFDLTGKIPYAAFSYVDPALLEEILNLERQETGAAKLPFAGVFRTVEEALASQRPAADGGSA